MGAEQTGRTKRSHATGHRRVTGQEIKGNIPVEAIHTNLTVWPSVRPLSERLFPPSEIIDITQLKPRQVYNALHQKDRIIDANQTYGLPAHIQQRRKEGYERAKRTSKGITPEQYEVNITTFTRRVLERGLISDISDWESVKDQLEAKGREVRSRSRILILETIVRAKRLIAEGNTEMVKFYPRLLRAIEGVFYREEDYADLNLIKNSSSTKKNLPFSK